MKNKELHDYVEAMNLQLPRAVRSQEVVRRAVLASPRRRTLSMRLKWAFTNGSMTMNKNKKVIGASALSVLLLATASFGVYTYKYSPKALAEQLVNQGILAIKAAPTEKITQLETVLGTNPTEALEEAKKANDLKVITKEEFDEEVKNTGGMFGTSLSSDPNAPQFGMATVTAGAAVGVEGEGSGPVTMPMGTPPPEGAVMVSGESGTIVGTSGDGTQTIHIKNSNQVTSSLDPNQTGPTYKVNMGNVPQGEGVTTATGTMKLPENFKPFQMETPSKYLRYTNSEGKVVVLSLNADGMPIFKSILLNPENMQNVQIKR